MSFSHIPRALARSSAPSARRLAFSVAARSPLRAGAGRTPSLALNQPAIRWASTAPAARPRTWGQWFRGGVVRVLLAGGVVYFYCTSPVFELQSDRQGMQTRSCLAILLTQSNRTPARAAGATARPRECADPRIAS
jgi:hypothetical protein